MMTSRTLPDGLNAAQVKRAGLLWHPKEVVAVVHALCDQDMAVAAPEELWITNEGGVLVAEPDSAAEAPLLTRIGFLIDTLLPPFSENRAYMPAASLQMIPARLRGTAEPPIVSTRELLSAIEHYETDVPARVLQQLLARVTAAAPERAVEEAVSPEPIEHEPTAFLVVPFEATDDSLDEYPTEQVAGLHRDDARSDRLMSGRGVTDPPEAAATAATRARTFARLAARCVGITSRLLRLGSSGGPATLATTDAGPSSANQMSLR
jgi:hypothetical protein